MERCVYSTQNNFCPTVERRELVVARGRSMPYA